MSLSFSVQRISIESGPCVNIQGSSLITLSFESITSFYWQPIVVDHLLYILTFTFYIIFKCYFQIKISFLMCTKLILRHKQDTFR